MPKQLRTIILPSHDVSATHGPSSRSRSSFAGTSAGSTVITQITDPGNTGDVLSSFVFFGCSGGPTLEHIGKVFQSLASQRDLDFVYMTGDFVYPHVSDDETTFRGQTRCLLPIGTLTEGGAPILADGVVCHLGVGNHEREAFNSKATLHKPLGFTAGNEKLATLVTHVERLDATLASTPMPAPAGTVRTINQLNLIPYYVHLIYRDHTPVMFLLVLDSNVPYDPEQLRFLNEVRKVLDATGPLADEVRFNDDTQRAMRETQCRILVTHQSVAPTHGKRYNKSESKKYGIEAQLDSLEQAATTGSDHAHYRFVNAALLQMLKKKRNHRGTVSELIEEMKAREGNIHQHVFSVFNAMLGSHLASFLNICAHEHTFCFANPGHIPSADKDVIPYATVCEGRGGSEDNRGAGHCVALPPGAHTSDLALAGFSRLTLRSNGNLVLESYDATTNTVMLTESLELPHFSGVRVLPRDDRPSSRITSSDRVTSVSLDTSLPKLHKNFFKGQLWEGLLSILRITQDIRYAVLHLFMQSEFAKALEHGDLTQSESGALISKSLNVDPMRDSGHLDKLDAFIMALHYLQLAHYGRVFPVASMFNMLSALRYVLEVTRNILPLDISLTQKVVKATNAIQFLRSDHAEAVRVDMLTGAGAGAGTGAASTYGTRMSGKAAHAGHGHAAHTEFEIAPEDFKFDRDTKALQACLMFVMKQRYQKNSAQFWQDVLKGDVDLYRYFLLFWLYAKSEEPVRLMLIYYFHLAAPDPHLQVRLGEQVEAHRTAYSSVFEHLELRHSDKGPDALPRLLAFEKLATHEAIKKLLCCRYFLETLKRFWLGAFKECAEDFSAALTARNSALQPTGWRSYLPVRFFPRAHTVRETDLERYLGNLSRKATQSEMTEGEEVSLEDMRIDDLSISYSSAHDRFVCADFAMQSSEIVRLLLAFANAALVEKKAEGTRYLQGYRK